MTEAKRIVKKVPPERTDQDKAFDARMKGKEDKPRPEAKDFPITTMMKKELDREVHLNQKCPNCKHFNKPDKHLIFPMRFDLMGESVPLIIWICNQCGMLFAPRWGRKIIAHGIQEQLKLHGKVEVDG